MRGSRVVLAARVAALAGVLALIGACADRPTAPQSILPQLSGTGPAATQSPVIWMAPLGTGTPAPATFDASAITSVEICAWNGSVCTSTPVAKFTTVPATGSLPLVVNTQAGYFAADWSLLNTSFTSRRTYRIRALHGVIEIAGISVDVVRGRWALTRTDGVLAPLSSAATLPIRFHLSIPPAAGRRAEFSTNFPTQIVQRVTTWRTLLGDAVSGSTLPAGATGLLLALDANDNIQFVTLLPNGMGNVIIDSDATALGEIRSIAGMISGLPVDTWTDAAFQTHPDYLGFRSQVLAAISAGQSPLETQSILQTALEIIRPVIGVAQPSTAAVSAIAAQSLLGEKTELPTAVSMNGPAAPVSFRYAVDGVHVTNPTPLTFATTIRKTGVPSDPGSPGPEILPNSVDVLLVGVSIAGEFTIEVGDSPNTIAENSQVLADALISSFIWLIPNSTISPNDRVASCVKSSLKLVLSGNARWTGYLSTGDFVGAMGEFSSGLTLQKLTIATAIQKCAPQNLANAAAWAAGLVSRYANPLGQLVLIGQALWGSYRAFAGLGDAALIVQYGKSTGSVGFCSSGATATSGSCQVTGIRVGAPAWVLTGQQFLAGVTVEGPGGSVLYGRPVTWSTIGAGFLLDPSDFGAVTIVKTAGVGSVSILATVGSQTSAATVDVTDLSDPNGGRGSTNPLSMYRTWVGTGVHAPQTPGFLLTLTISGSNSGAQATATYRDVNQNVYAPCQGTVLNPTSSLRSLQLTKVGPLTGGNICPFLSQNFGVAVDVTGKIGLFLTGWGSLY